MQKFVIYSITLIGTQDAYIGSSIACRNRWKKHRFDLRRGNHHCAGLQNSWNENGETAFLFEILAEYEAANVNERAAVELQWIIAKGNLNAINSYVNTHNLHPMSDAQKILKSAETRAKIASDPEYAKTVARTGKAIGAYMQTPEARAAMSKHSKRRWQDTEERKKLQAGLMRTQNDPEIEARRAAKIKSAHSTPEMKAMHRENHAKLMANPEIKAKMDAGSVKRWSNPEAKAHQAQKMREHHARRRAAKANASQIDPADQT